MMHSEAKRAVTDTIHFPSGKSGVTIGPGYDMGHRDGHAIIDDLQKVGAPEAVAIALPDGNHGVGAEAQAVRRIRSTERTGVI